MTSKWTPGPWIVPDGGQEIEIVTAEESHDIATMNHIGDVAEANARLIAAAPEMAEVLDALFESSMRLADLAGIMPDEDAVAIEAARALLARINGDK